MNTRTRGPISATLVAVWTLAAAPLTGQDTGVAGTWDVTWAQAVRTLNGELVEIQRWGVARLVLTQEGDRVRGTWWSAVGEVTWQVEGTLAGTRMSLTATEHDSTDPQLSVLRAQHWRGTLDGDVLEGEMWLELGRADRVPARRPWRAVRPPPGADPPG